VPPFKASRSCGAGSTSKATGQSKPQSLFSRDRLEGHVDATSAGSSRHSCSLRSSAVDQNAEQSAPLFQTMSFERRSSSSARVFAQALPRAPGRRDQGARRSGSSPACGASTKPIESPYRNVRGARTAPPRTGIRTQLARRRISCISELFLLADHRGVLWRGMDRAARNRHQALAARIARAGRCRFCQMKKRRKNGLISSFPAQRAPDKAIESFIESPGSIRRLSTGLRPGSAGPSPAR